MKYRPWMGMTLWLSIVALDKAIMGDHMGYISIGGLFLICVWASRAAR